MNGPKRRFFAGNSLRQALMLAASHYAIEPDELAFTEIEKRHGFLKARHRVVIEVDPDNPRRVRGEAPAAIRDAGADEARAVAATPEAIADETVGPAGWAPPRREPARADEGRPSGAPRGGRGDRRPERRPRWGDERAGREPRRPGSPAAAGTAGQAAPPRGPRAGGEPLHTGGPRGGRAERATAELEAEGLITLPEAPRRASERYPTATGPVADAAERGLRHLLELTGLDLSFRIHQGEGRLEIDLSGDDAELCSSEEGELLRAIEHLLPRLIRTLAGEAVPCRVDCDNFHEIWEERLRSLAQRLADEVRRRGRPRTLEPMNPADRRIVHMTLADDPAVETESEGEGYFKRITIRPV
jgi:spoIIIJ-associated protein